MPPDHTSRVAHSHSERPSGQERPPGAASGTLSGSRQAAQAWTGNADPATRPDADVPLPQHPGPVGTVRRTVLGGREQNAWRIPLPAGLSLHAAVTGAMAQLGVQVAALHLVRAEFSHLRYFEIATSPEAVPVAHYTTPLDRAGPLSLVCAGVTIGQTAQGDAAIHCHALTVDAHGQFVGGHLLPEACVLAHTGVAWLHALDHMHLTIGEDAEICTPVFHPRLRETHEHDPH